MTDQSESSEPSLLSHMKAAYSEAKTKRTRFWQLEVGAAVVSLMAAFMPVPWFAALLALGAVAAKIGARLVADASRATFRQAERARRYDFERRTLNWSVPAHAHGALLFAFSETVEQRARELAVADQDYYAVQGPPSTSRFLQNLAESVFWNEKLGEVMAGRRGWQLAAAGAVVGGALVGLVVIQPSGLVSVGTASGLAFGGIRAVGAFMAVLVAVNVWGEWASHRRGAQECARVFQAVEAALAAPPDAARDEGLRLWVEYNCVLTELPMVPDEIHAREHSRLTRLWQEVAARLPGHKA